MRLRIARVGKFVTSATAVVILWAGATASPARAATPEEVDKSIARAKAFLYSKLNASGNWEEVQQRDPNAGHADVKGNQWGGLTAVATYALLAGGESPQEPRLKKAIDFLKRAEMSGIYAVGMRCQVWHLIPQTPDVRPLVKRDGALLLAAINKSGRAKALYNYYLRQYAKPTDARIDHSVSQYGVLGMWALEQSGFEVGMDYWRAVDEAWSGNQHADGAWSYDHKSDNPDWNKPTHSMTAAGVATLFITQDYIRAGNVGCTGNAVNVHLDKGLEWMSANFSAIANGTAGNLYYTLYGVERIGVASGYKYFGNVDWYQVGANLLVQRQSKEGSWEDHGSIPGTSFGILFLARGRAPVVMNKLQYGAGEDGKKVAWNQRARDAANVTHWIGRNAERALNWQIVNLSRPAEELSDAPILYIAGSEAPSFTPEEKTKLKTYVENGGLILANADCGNAAFANGMRKLGSELFPMNEFRELPAEHVIYANQQFQRSKWRTKPSILAVGNGVREQMLVIPQADPARQWQTQSDKGKEELFQLMANIFLYAVDKQNLNYKGLTHLVAPAKDAKPTRTFKVARLEYSGNWNPEPGGWRRLTNVMLNEKKVGLTVETVKLGAGKLAGFRVAHLTGTTKFRLDEAAKAEIKAFIAAGGTLVVDAAGGNAEFALSAENELKAMYPTEGTGLAAPLPADHAIYNIPDAKIANVAYRTFARARLSGETKNARLRGITVGGRVAVVFSPEDLSAGLVGNEIDGIIGYAPATATALMRNILLHANAAK